MNIVNLLSLTKWSDRIGHTVVLRNSKASSGSYNCIEATWDDLSYHLGVSGTSSLDDLGIDSAIVVRANMLGKPGQNIVIYKFKDGGWFRTGDVYDADFSFEKEFKDGHH